MDGERSSREFLLTESIFNNWRVCCENSNSPCIAIFQESEKRLLDIVWAGNERYFGFKTFLNYGGTLQIWKNSIPVECECAHSMQSWQLVDLCGFHNKEGWVSSVNVGTTMCIGLSSGCILCLAAQYLSFCSQMGIDEENREECWTCFIKGLYQDLHKKYENALAKNAELGEAKVWTMCKEWATTRKTILVTASQVGDWLARVDYCYFHQTATLNMYVFLFLLLFSQKTNVTIVFSVKFSFRIIFYLNLKKNGLLLFSQQTLQLLAILTRLKSYFGMNVHLGDSVVLV